MSKQVQVFEPGAVQGSTVQLTVDIVVLAAMAIWYSGAGGTFSDGPRKGQAIQAMSGWGAMLKPLNDVISWSDEHNDYISWSFGEQMQEFNGVMTRGIFALGRVGVRNGKGEFVHFWYPVESLAKVTMIAEGLRLR